MKFKTRFKINLKWLSTENNILYITWARWVGFVQGWATDHLKSKKKKTMKKTHCVAVNNHTISEQI